MKDLRCEVCKELNNTYCSVCRDAVEGMRQPYFQWLTEIVEITEPCIVITSKGDGWYELNQVVVGGDGETHYFEVANHWCDSWNSLEYFLMDLQGETYMLIPKVKE